MMVLWKKGGSEYLTEGTQEGVKLIAHTVFPEHTGKPEDVAVHTAPVWASCGRRWKALRSHFPYCVTGKSPGVGAPPLL